LLLLLFLLLLLLLTGATVGETSQTSKPRPATCAR
jgi:hypothetical protein